jgi:hypothetical protein
VFTTQEFCDIFNCVASVEGVYFFVLFILMPGEKQGEPGESSPTYQWYAELKHPRTDICDYSLKTILTTDVWGVSREAAKKYAEDNIHCPGGCPAILSVTEIQKV